MEYDVIRLAVRGMSMLLALEGFGLLMATAVSYHPGRLILRAYEGLRYRARSFQTGIFDYHRTEMFLNQNGARFHFGRWVEPISFMALKLILAAAGLLTVHYLGGIYGVIISGILYLLPTWLLLYLNKQDNENMLAELKLVYHALALQIKAGVYVTDALAEMYGSIRERRLNQALLELSGEIVMKADVVDALEEFQGKFNNRYVDALCITILQALESGQAVELLSDIAEQIKDMEAAVLAKKKGALDRSVTFYQLGILTIILAIVLYACVSHMFTAAVSF